MYSIASSASLYFACSETKPARAGRKIEFLFVNKCLARFYFYQEKTISNYAVEKRLAGCGQTKPNVARRFSSLDQEDDKCVRSPPYIRCKRRAIIILTTMNRYASILLPPDMNWTTASEKSAPALSLYISSTATATRAKGNFAARTCQTDNFAEPKRFTQLTIVSYNKFTIFTYSIKHACLFVFNPNSVFISLLKTWRFCILRVLIPAKKANCFFLNTECKNVEITRAVVLVYNAFFSTERFVYLFSLQEMTDALQLNNSFF